MKSSSVILIAITTLISGFIIGFSFCNYRISQKSVVKNKQIDFLILLHDSYRKDLNRANAASDSVLGKIFPLITDGTLTFKGKVSIDPIKKLLWESYHVISGNMEVQRGYVQQVYPQDSAFLKKYSMTER